MSGRKKAAVVGCGWAGKIHARVYHDHPGVQLAAVCDPDFGKAKTLASELNCHPYPSLEALLANEQIDMVSLASPTETHVSLGKKIIGNGIPVLCEKPLSRDAPSARELNHEARIRNVPLGVNYNRRFAAGYQQARNRLAGAGQIHFITAILAENVPLTHTTEQRSRLPEDFLVFDALSHIMDLVCVFAGRPRKIYALGNRSIPGQLWTDIQVGLYFESGALGSLICSLAGPEWGQLPIERAEIGTEKERIIIDNITTRVEWFTYRERERHVWEPNIFEPNSYLESLHSSITAWVEAILNGTPPPISGEDGVEVVEHCERVLAALKAQEGG